jgi:hypothetical protein
VAHPQGALAARVPKTSVLDPALCALIEEAGANASRRAAQLLAIDAEGEQGYQDWHRALVQFSHQGPAALVKTAAAVVAAHGEEQLRGGYRRPDAYLALLDALGYEADEAEFPKTTDVASPATSDPPSDDET